MNKIVTFTIILLLFLLSFFSFSSTLQLSFLYHLQQPVFLTTKDFFVQFLTFPGGLSEYLALFSAQFFQFQTGGALVIALIAVIMYLASYSVLRGTSDTNTEKLLSLLPSTTFLFLLTDSKFPLSSGISILLVLAFLLIFKIFSKNTFALIGGSIILPFVAYLFAGSGALWLFSISAALFLLTIFPIKKGFLYLLLLIVFSIPIPWISYHYLFNINEHIAFFSFFPEVPHHLRYSIEWPFKLFFTSTAIILALSIIVKMANKFFPNLPGFIAKPLIPAGLVIACVLVLLIIKERNVIEKVYARANYHNIQGNWEKVEEEILNLEKYDYRLNYLFIRAIDKQGKFIEKFFNYPQLAGSDILFPDKMNSGALAMFSSDFYFDLGYINESMHWAYEALSTSPHNKRVLERLVETNLIAGNIEGVEAFLNQLKNQLFEERFIEKYQAFLNDTSLISKDPLFAEKRRQMPVEKVIPDESGIKFRYLLLKDSTNKKAYEHLQMYNLLNHQLGDFLNMYKTYPWLNKEQLPDPFAQAVILFLLRTNQEEYHKYPLSEHSKKRIMNYMKMLKSFNGNKEEAKNNLMPEHWNSFMFYLNYYSPLITKGGLKSREVREYQN